MVKCELIAGGYSYRVTDDVANWDDIVVSFKRGDYDGVNRSYSSKFEFVNSAYSLLKKQYRDNYLEAAASVVISKRNNSWTWNELFRCTLDFSTYEDLGNTISINAIDDSLASIIKAKKSTQYEYSVDVVKEERKLYYDGIKIENAVKWINTGTLSESGESTSSSITGINESFFVPFGITSNEIDIKNHILCGEQSSSKASEDTGSYLIKAERGKCKVHLRLKFNIHVSRWTSGVSEEEGVSVGFSKTTDYKTFKLVDDGNGKYLNKLQFTSNDNWENTMEYDQDIVLNEGEFLLFTAGASSPVKNPTIRLSISSFEYFEISWKDKSDPISIDVVFPKTLLNRLMQSMNGGENGLSGEIESAGNPRLENCMIIAAESVRGIKGAKLYSSFNKFADWMEAEFGYVYDISDKKVTFRHRTKYFTDEIVKEVSEFSDFSYSVNSSLIYSRIRVGYDKQDYDSVNGRDEFRFTNTFSTGRTLTDNSLELISPYRADVYGIEFLVQKRGKDTTDTDSDSDVFIVGAKLSNDGTRYEFIRSGYSISGVLSPDSMFNVMYSPRQMLMSNIGFIGICTEKLTYTSGEGNVDVSINGEKETDDLNIPIKNRLTTVGEVSFSTPENEVPKSRIGLVSLTKNGEKYLGYIMKANINAGREECVKFTLSVKSVQ